MVPQRRIRSLFAVGVLALGDYLLWNWSLGANRDVVALVSGVTLIPLLIALTWLLVFAAVRLLAFVVRRSRPGATAGRGEVGGALRVRGGPGAAVRDAVGAHHRAAPGAHGDTVPAANTPGDTMPAAAAAAAVAHATPSPSSQLAA